ncbi:BgTH12-05835 [Blumeria graminis f. sp. triticale]|uniref:BgTH12-05835 n=2 Tax=Blumeria graminis TaxID=34373 RepID=A0A9W4GGQ1_BLUGR|nr:BgTH12-05835 [Blumeria graminis f. sp. triticale]
MWHALTLSTISLILTATLPTLVLGGQVLRTSSFTTCLSNTNTTVQHLDIKYNAEDRTVTFNVTGTSGSVQNVTAQLNVTAYGIDVYHNTFNPCSTSTFVSQICPLPAGTFSANGTQTIPDQYASQIPDIAFSVPDISATATLQLKSLDTGADIACVQAEVNNGKTAGVPAISFVAAGIAGAALVVTGASAGAATVGGSVSGGTGTTTPSFTEVFGWFQGIAINGMMSVNYPPVYRAFAKNFAFSTGIIPWTVMQVSIDDFRARTGGDLSHNSVEGLRQDLDGTSSAKISRRAYQAVLMTRDAFVAPPKLMPAEALSDPLNTKVEVTVKGIKGYVEELSVPETNVFMTVLLAVVCVIAAITVGILLLKVVLEAWAVFGSFPKGLAGFREHYWATMARLIVQLILVLYGVWVLYCIFQFTHGDSWAAKTLAGITLSIFTGTLAFFTFKIWQTAKKLKETEGDASGLYEKKENWIKYSMFYDSYSKDHWWLFLPAIIYMFAKGCVLAAADGHGLTQTLAQLSIELFMLIILIWNRPFERRSGNVMNIIIQLVRALSVACILVFVEELGISQTTQTITGVVLIAAQSILTGVLALLIATNAIIMCCKQNPHRKRRKEAGKLNQSPDSPPPLENEKYFTDSSVTEVKTTYSNDPPRFYPEPMAPNDNQFYQESIYSNARQVPVQQYRPYSGFENTSSRGRRTESRDGLLERNFQMAAPDRQPYQQYQQYQGRY